MFVRSTRSYSLVMLCAIILVPEGTTASAGEPVRHRIMIADYNPTDGHRLLEVSPEGKLVWQFSDRKMLNGLCQVSILDDK